MKNTSGIEHLHGNFYKVPFASILTPDRNDDSNDFSFSNPRLLTQSGVNTLTDKKISSDLREDIKKRTLLTALICRWVEHEGEAKPQLVGGDRRYRALDYLIKKKEEVVDPRTQGTSTTTADAAYEYVVCQIFSCDNDLDAAVLSWAENKNRVDLTEGHEVAAVVELRKFNVSDEKILEVLQRDPKWLKDTDELIESLDQETLSLLCEDKLKRGAAAHIAKIEVEKRPAVLKAALEKSEQIYEQRVEMLDKQMASVNRKRDRAETKKIIAEDSGDSKLLERSEKVLARSNEREKEIVDKKAKTKPIASKKMVEAVCKEVGVDVNDVKKAGKKTIRKILSQIQGIIKVEGEVCLPDDNFYLDVTFLELIKMVLEKHALNDSEDFLDTLADWRSLYPEDSVDTEEDEETEESDLDDSSESEYDDEDDEDDENEDENEDEDEDENEDVSASDIDNEAEDAYPEDGDFYGSEDSEDDEEND